MKYAVSAIARARFTDCSTRMIVVPWARMSLTMPSNWSTTAGASPSDSSSIISRRGFMMKHMPEREHLLLAARQRCRRARRGARAQHWEDVEHALGGLGHGLLLVVGARPARELQVVGHAQPGERALTARHEHHTARGHFVGWRVGGVAAVEHHGAVGGLDEPADRLQQCRLARTVRAEQRDDLAFVDLEVHAEQHLHAVVVHVDVADEQQLGELSPARRWNITSACAAVDVHTRLMSDFTYSDAVAMIHAPMRKIGAMMIRGRCGCSRCRRSM